jgi:DNA-binding PadR family transcriptional regulator
MKHHNHRFGHHRHSGRGRFEKEDGSRGLSVRYRHGGGARGGHGGRGEGKRFFERGRFKFALLELLASEPMHGYQMIKAMEEKTGGLYSPSPGSIYPNLQLLEDMQLIGYSEADGKKLYHITDEGRTYLRDKGGADTEQPGSRWEHHGRHRHRGGGYGKRHLRSFMKEYSDVIYLMARAAEAAKEHPEAEQAVKFQELMTQLQGNLKQLVGSLPQSEWDDAVRAALQTEFDSSSESSQDEE